eukprot:718462_1
MSDKNTSNKFSFGHLSLNDSSSNSSAEFFEAIPYTPDSCRNSETIDEMETAKWKAKSAPTSPVGSDKSVSPRFLETKTLTPSNMAMPNPVRHRKTSENLVINKRVFCKPSQRRWINTCPASFHRPPGNIRAQSDQILDRTSHNRTMPVVSMRAQSMRGFDGHTRNVDEQSAGIRAVHRKVSGGSGLSEDRTEAIQKFANSSRKSLTLSSFGSSRAATSRDFGLANVTVNDTDVFDVDQRKEDTGWYAKAFDTGEAGSDPKYDVRVKHKKHHIPTLAPLRRVQELKDHSGPVWTMKFSPDGNYLATGGQDSVVRVWTVIGGSEDRRHTERLSCDGRVSEPDFFRGLRRHSRSTCSATSSSSSLDQPHFVRDIFNPISVRCFSGHKSDIISLAWSKANFLLSASMDRTVMLWHTSRPACLCLFQHSDFVTSVAFHPIDDTIFLSGCFDRKIRLWNILDHRVVDWAQTPSLITSAVFSPKGEHCVAGLYDGQCVFYNTKGMTLRNSMECRNRRGKYASGRKVTGLQYTADGTMLLVTTNDSRIRMYSMIDFTMVQKYKGLENTQLQIHASFSPDETVIVCGSDDQRVYLWKTDLAQSQSNGGFLKNKDRNDSYEYFKVGPEIVTVAVLAPRSSIAMSQSSSDARDEHLMMRKGQADGAPERPIKHLIVSADYSG